MAPDSITSCLPAREYSFISGEQQHAFLNSFHIYRTGAELGVAWTKALCTTSSHAQSSGTGTEYVSGTGVSSVTRDEWKVVAHEVGHGFGKQMSAIRINRYADSPPFIGAMHDCTPQTCPCSGASCQCCPLSDTQCDAGGTFIMNPVNNASAGEFSPCTLKTICGLFPTLGSCLQGKWTAKGGGECNQLTHVPF